MNRLPGYDQPRINREDHDVLYASLATEASKSLTICEQLRFIYDTVHQLPGGEVKNDLTEKLIVAFDMGKKMNARLAHYKREYVDKTGHRGKSLLQLSHRAERERERRMR